MAAAINSIPEFVPSSMSQNQSQPAFNDGNVVTHDFNQNDSSDYWYAESKDCQCCMGYKYSCQCCSQEYGGNYECTYCSGTYYNNTEEYNNFSPNAGNYNANYNVGNTYNTYGQANNQPNGSPRNYSQYNESNSFGLNTKAQEFVPSFATSNNYGNANVQNANMTASSQAGVNANANPWNYKPPATVFHASQSTKPNSNR